MAEGKVCESAAGLVKEHKRLVKTLRSGSPKERAKEAKDQAGELREYKRSVPRRSGGR